jgi:hypothetical protein
MPATERTLYFREAPHESYLVFVPPERAHFIDQIHRAIRESGTWGDSVWPAVLGHHSRQRDAHRSAIFLDPTLIDQ